MRYLVFLFFLLPSMYSQAFDHQHQDWNNYLQTHVTDHAHHSTFDYELASQPASKQLLESYLQSLSAIEVERFNAWENNQKLAFLINSYNAFTIQWVLQHYPIESIRDTGFLFKTPWKYKFISLLGEQTSLGDIEHKRLRKNYNEPRIHFAINCASIGCPALASYAYRADNLDAQLHEATMRFLNDSTRNHADGDTLYLSPIFKWFKKDFISDQYGLEHWVSQYWNINPAEIKRIKFTRYDWDLNITQ